MARRVVERRERGVRNFFAKASAAGQASRNT
jgi:hypothetical protein